LTGDVTAGLPAWNMPRLFVTASNRVDGTTYTAAASALSGDTGTAEGVHHVVWDLDAQGLRVKSTNVVFEVAYATAEYCVIDLSGGANASSYPVTYVASVPSGGFNTDEYKTTKLVLRLIEPGTFMMGGSYQVTLTKPFYCGVFEVTQKQYELVTGSNPSYYQGDMRPVEQVSWNTIRGDSSTYNWPGSANVDSSTFIGKLQARTGLNFDLPTEAQWEYACRAGTTSTYNNGGDTENDLKQLGRYSGDKSDGKGGYTDVHTKVGSYEPNAWGLYDMHGNVWEWCLDWHGNLSSGVTDPRGSSSGSSRVLRGSSWGINAGLCASSYRSGYSPSYGYNDYGLRSSLGFRLVRTLSN
jgi:formylglycine-generating enzyme required for sulfatase activity